MGVKESSGNEMFTPDVIRKTAAPDAQPPTRPGDKSPSKARTPDARARALARGSALSHCCQSLGLVPWWSLLSLALLVGGLTIYAVKGMPAANAASALLHSLGSSGSKSGFPFYMSIYSSSVWASVGVAGAVTALIVFSASVRVDQQLRKAGRYSTATGSYRVALYRFFVFTGWLGLLLALAFTLWTAVVGLLLTSWAAQCWNLQRGSLVAAGNSAALGNVGSQYGQLLQGLAATLSSNATNVTASIQQLQQLSGILSEAPDTAPLQSQGQAGVCPTAYCLSMGLYPFTESASCVCTAAALHSLHNAAQQGSRSAVWALVGLAALFVGALAGCLQLSADCAMLAADQLFLSVIRRRSSRPGTGNGRESGRKEDAAAAYRMRSPMPQYGSAPSYAVAADTQPHA